LHSLYYTNPSIIAACSAVSLACPETGHTDEFSRYT
jgi:hypothetical protein